MAAGAEADSCALPFFPARGARAGKCAPVFAFGGSAPVVNLTPPLPYSGRGVTVAVIDTGIYPHLDFLLMRNRIAAFKDCIAGKETPYDDNGHGTAVCGVIAGNGAMSCGRGRAAAYKASLAVVKAIDAKGEGNALHILEGMQWIYSNRRKYNIRVVNMSFGSRPLGAGDPLVLGAEALWRCGITVVASAGNLGPEGSTILPPAVSPSVVTVGGASGGSAAAFSSRGPAGAFRKPDLLAPAENVRSTAPGAYGLNTGTSMAAPQIAALSALAYEAEPDILPDKVKELLLASCVPVDGCAGNVCGEGIIDAVRFCARLTETFGRPDVSREE